MYREWRKPPGPQLLARPLGAIAIVGLVSDPSLLPLQQLVSRERMATYLAATAGDPVKAARLYMWNIEISTCLWGPISILEVILRNALHEQLVTRFGTRWYEAGSGCTLRVEHERRHIVSAIKYLERQDVLQPTPGQVVGATSFGLWVGLVGAGTPRGRDGFHPATDYDRVLWSPQDGLQCAFPHLNGMNRRNLHSKLSGVQTLRNRIAHHEPIHQRSHNQDLRIIVECVATISPDTATFIAKSHSVKSAVSNMQAAVNDGDCCI